MLPYIFFRIIYYFSLFYLLPDAAAIFFTYFRCRRFRCYYRLFSDADYFRHAIAVSMIFSLSPDADDLIYSASMIFRCSLFSLPFLIFSSFLFHYYIR